jgi:hypothetical protein
VLRIRNVVGSVITGVISCVTRYWITGPTHGTVRTMSAQSAIARGDLRAYEESVRLATPELVERLRDLLGAKLVAYLGSVQETRAVRQWADTGAARTPSTDVVNRLRMAYRIAALLHERDSAAVVQAWFQGMNPRLDDVAPARLLREGDLEQVGPQVLAAARSFAVGG